MMRASSRLAALIGLLALAACSSDTNSTDACPVLCTDPTLAVRDTVLETVVLDTAMGDFPLPGAIGSAGDEFVPLVHRRDTTDVRLVLRWDTLPTRRSQTDTTPISRVRNAAVLLFVDTLASTLPAGGATIELFDVDTLTAADSTAAAARPLFRPDRRLAARTFTRAELRDTLRLPLPDSLVLARILAGGRLRIGFRVEAATAVALRVLRPNSATVDLTPRLVLDPSPDDTARVQTVFTTSSTPFPGGASNFKSLVVVERGSPPIGGPDALDVGGLPAVRSYIRFDVPRRFFDSVTVVRATLDLVQRPRPGVGGVGDTVSVRPRVVTAGRELVNVRQQLTLLNPVLEGTRFPSRRLVPRDSGLRSFDVGNLLSAWATRPDSLSPTALVIVADLEGFADAPIAFWSREAPSASLRPRLRITFAPRRQSILP